MVQVASLSQLDPDPEPELEGAIPPLGPNPAIRRVWDASDHRELRWWVIVFLGALALSLVALWAVR